MGIATNRIDKSGVSSTATDQIDNSDVIVSTRDRVLHSDMPAKATVPTNQTGSTKTALNQTKQAKSTNTVTDHVDRSDVLTTTTDHDDRSDMLTAATVPTGNTESTDTALDRTGKSRSTNTTAEQIDHVDVTTTTTDQIDYSDIPIKETIPIDNTRSTDTTLDRTDQSNEMSTATDNQQAQAEQAKRVGLKRTDHALYPMALRSLNQAILYLAETYFIEDELLSAMTIDHSLYHLSVFLLFISSFSLSERRKYRIIKRIEQLANEPSRIVNQISFDSFIRKFEEGNAPESIIDFLSRWRKLRQFVNFGFSVRFASGGLKVEDTGDLKNDLKIIRRSLGEVFTYAIRTACLSCPDSGRFMLNTLNLSKKFFVNPNDLYGQYCSKAILLRAEELQQKLIYGVKMEMLDSL